MLLQYPPDEALLKIAPRPGSGLGQDFVDKVFKVLKSVQYLLIFSTKHQVLAP
jgi:hypothetical protein